LFSVLRLDLLLFSLLRYIMPLSPRRYLTTLQCCGMLKNPNTVCKKRGQNTPSLVVWSIPPSKFWHSFIGKVYGVQVHKCRNSKKVKRTWLSTETCRCRTDIDKKKPDSHENYAYALGDICLTFKLMSWTLWNCCVFQCIYLLIQHCSCLLESENL